MDLTRINVNVEVKTEKLLFLWKPNWIIRNDLKIGQTAGNYKTRKQEARSQDFVTGLSRSPTFNPQCALGKRKRKRWDCSSLAYLTCAGPGMDF